MKSLELTKEQGQAVWAAMNASGMECHRGQVMAVVVPLVRDMVLEAAALECEAKSHELHVLQIGTSAMQTTWHEAAQAIRAMKGTAGE